MIVGNGLIGKAFEMYRNNENVLIFCSGVSNSREVDTSQFEREIKLIEEYITSNKRFIYFSTVSLVDGSDASPYTQHKSRIEKFITENHKNYIIFRLPIIVGYNANKVTFFNSITNKIKNNEIIDVYNVSRYLIDIDHLSSTLPTIIDGFESCMTINVCFDNFSSVSEIVDKMQYFLNGKSNKNFVECSPNHEVDNEYFISKVKDIDIDFTRYNDYIIKKYCVSKR